MGVSIVELRVAILLVILLGVILLPNRSVTVSAAPSPLDHQLSVGGKEGCVVVFPLLASCPIRQLDVSKKIHKTHLPI